MTTHTTSISFLSLWILFLVSCVTSEDHPRVNLIQDPSFENGNAWQGVVHNVVPSTRSAHTGKKSLSLPENRGTIGVYQNIDEKTLDKARFLTLSGWASSDSSASASMFVQLTYADGVRVEHHLPVGEREKYVFRHYLLSFLLFILMYSVSYENHRCRCLYIVVNVTSVGLTKLNRDSGEAGTVGSQKWTHKCLAIKREGKESITSATVFIMTNGGRFSVQFLAGNL